MLSSAGSTLLQDVVPQSSGQPWLQQGKADAQQQQQSRSTRTHAAQEMAQMPMTGANDASPEVPSCS